MPRTRRRAHRTWPQRFLLGVNAVLVVACLGAAFGLSQIRSRVEDVPVVEIGSSLTPTAPEEMTGARNILIIGTDSASRLDEDDPVTKGRETFGQLADVIMILRINPDDGTARLLSIPRDSRVEVAPSWGLDKINAAIAAGGDEGARNLVRTIKHNFGISVDNYVEIDFKSFRDLVEVLGGVPVYFTTPVRDRNSGLYVDSPGCILLSPDQALAWSRARHFEYKVDGKWRTDPTGDVGRISRQQEFIKRSLRRASDKGIRNPGTAIGIVNAATSSVTMDDTLNVGAILDLLGGFQTFDPNSLDSVQVPSVGNKRGGIWYQDILWDDAEPVIEQFWSGMEGALVPENVIVEVIGRSRDLDTLTAVADQLDSVGFDAEALTTTSRPSTTTITFGPRGRDAALLLAAQLDGDFEVEFDEDIVGRRVELQLASDVPTVRGEAVPVDQLPVDLVPSPATTSTSTVVSDDGATDEPDEAAEGDSPEETEGSWDEVPEETVDEGAATPTTVPGVVPVDPERAATCR